MLAIFQCFLTDYCKKKKPKNCTHAINIVCVIYLVFFDWSAFEIYFKVSVWSNIYAANSFFSTQNWPYRSTVLCISID